MYGLQLRAVVWEAGGDHHELDHDTVSVHRRGQAVVVAEAPVASALADVVCGLTRPASGEIRVNDRTVTAGSPTPGEIALVPLGGGLLPHLSVARNIGFALRRSNANDRRALVDNMAHRLQLGVALDLLPHRLSAEQRLRVAAARALVCWPSALLIEDRRGGVSCAAVAQVVAGQNVAVLVVTDAADRAGEISSRMYHAHPVATA
ncbi:MAG TPA: ATP-binding cassette domain-containing protein [Mycobacteriales bacterium]|nr:ATP-binding cassette domain-containing protein [Mycobacteriales bacterium]